MSRRSVPLFTLALAATVAASGSGAQADPARGSRFSGLASSTPIVVVWGDSARARGSLTGDLYLVQPDGTRARALKRWGSYGRDGKPYGAFDARWSPDHSRIGLSLAVFYADPGSQVAVIEGSGVGLRSLTRGWERQFEAWTQDGRGLVHGVYWRRGPFRVVPSAGGRSTPLRIAPASNYRLRDFDWSWTASRIAAALSDSGIVTMDLHGRGLFHVTRGNDVGPVWSPDGRTLMFTRLRNNGIADLYSIGATGGSLRKLVSGPGVRGLDWSPDGTKILFIRGEPIPGKPKQKSEALWVMGADGNAKSRLAFNRAGWDVLSADW